MTRAKSPEHWVQTFEYSVIGQTEALKKADYRTGNRFAKKYIAAFERLRAMGDTGRDAMLPLLSHARPDVRAMAATCLLRYKTKESLSVLRKEAAGKGLSALGASEAIKRWEEGTWNLDPQ